VSIEIGVLYVVATPIGNLGDMSPRAVQVLSSVDYIAAEDTRRSKRLLQHFGIHKPLISLHEHNEQYRVPQLLANLLAGSSIALVSDAGTPLISDPGYQLVRSLREKGIKVIPIPGPSSLLAGLSVAGLPTDRFILEGFLPAKSSARLKRLESLKGYKYTLVFFEASHRIQASLSDMAVVLGEQRQAVVARELTKLFEEIQGGSLNELCQWLAADEKRRLGEFVVIVQGAPEQAEPVARDPLCRLLKVLLEELPIKQAVKVAANFTDLSKNNLYELALEISSKKRSLHVHSGKEKL
jgi:16S rRNA (cytidine1402-2'-O)-methyltransferase